jgi:aspartokinase
VIDEISPRSRDTIVGLGERLACKIMVGVLRDQGIDAEYVSLENVVPPSDDLEAAEDGSLDQEFYDRLARAVGERVKQCGRRVPVVTGTLSISFQLDNYHSYFHSQVSLARSRVPCCGRSGADTRTC